MQNAFLEQHLPKAQQEGYEYLKREVPELKAIHDTELIENITLVRMQLMEGLLGMVELDVVAPRLFPHARATLIKEGVARKHNVLNVLQKDQDIQKLRLGFYGNALKVILNIRNQAATSDNRD